MPHTFRARVLVGASALAAAAALALAGCSASSPNPGSTGSGEVDAAGLAAAQQVIAPYLERSVSIPDLNPPIPVNQPLKTLPTGKKFAYVECNVPECAVVGTEVQAAVAALGGQFQNFKQGSDTQSTADAFQAAFDWKPDVVIEDAIDPATWTAQLNQFKDANIPVLAWTVPNEPAAPGVTAVFQSGDTYKVAGQLMADYVIAKSEGKANVVVFYPPEYTVFLGLAQSFQDEIKKNCTSCTVGVQSVPASEIGSQLPARVVSYVQANPNTNWVVGAFGSVLIGVPQALKAAGIEGISTLSQAGGQVNFQYIKDGLQTADLSNDLHQEGWIAVDMAAKLVTGQAIDDVTHGSRTAERFLTQGDITFDPEAGFNSVPDFQDYFKKLWGVQ